MPKSRTRKKTKTRNAKLRLSAQGLKTGKNYDEIRRRNAQEEFTKMHNEYLAKKKAQEIADSETNHDEESLQMLQATLPIQPV